MTTQNGLLNQRRSIGKRMLTLGVGIIAASLLAACGASPTTQSAATSAATVAPTSAPATTEVPAATEMSATLAPTEAAAETTAEATPEAATTAAAETTMDATAASTEAVTSTETTTATTGAASTDASAEAVVFQIDPSQSEASFTLNEKLMGEDKTVVGTTSKVTGVITASPSNPSASQIGIIQIDASDLTTDSNMRNGAIDRFILQTSQYQYITFEPTAIEGLPSEVMGVGTSVPVKVTGNLTIREITQPVTFDTTLTLKSDTELEGTATTTVTRAAFQLEIPNVPSVADVTDDVALQLKFVATKQ